MQDFWDLVDVRGPDECWEWKGYRTKKGYGRLCGYPSHRIAYALATGKSLGAKFGCHSCDNPPCCNPTHIFPGTQKENMQDMIRKGRASSTNFQVGHKRTPTGLKHPRGKLSNKQVKKIRQLALAGKLLQKEIAELYDICPATVSKIKLNLRRTSR